MSVRRLHNIEWIVCVNCGTYIYPPLEVSSMGMEDYIETFAVPPAEPKKIPTDEELAEINRARRDIGLAEFRDVEEWKAYYRDWAAAFRGNVRATVEKRFDELREHLRELNVVEEDEAFKIIGKRYKAVYEETAVGWRLRCPKCDAILLECSSAL